jgi:hypothetical protein
MQPGTLALCPVLTMLILNPGVFNGSRSGHLVKVARAKSKEKLNSTILFVNSRPLSRMRESGQ